MALLVADASRIEGPQSDVLHVLYGAMFDTLKRQAGLTLVQADQLAMQCLVRLQARLASAGYVVRDG